MNIRIITRFVSIAAVLCLILPGPGRADPEDDWLTPHERTFLTALGVDAIVDGKAVNRRIAPWQVLQAADEAESTLANRIRAYVAARQRMKVSDKELNEVVSLYARAQARFGIQFLFEMIRIDTGADFLESGFRLTEAMLNQPDMSSAMDLQAGWVERALRELEESNAQMTEILDEIHQRVGDGPAEVAQIEFLLDERPPIPRIRVEVGDTPLEEPIVQVVIHRELVDPPDYISAFISLQFIRLMGIHLSFEPVYQAGRLQHALEQFARSPIMLTQHLPTIGPEQVLTLRPDKLEKYDLAGINRVEVRVIHRGGGFALSEVPGLEGAKLRANLLIEEERKRQAIINQIRAKRKRLRDTFQRKFNAVLKAYQRGLEDTAQGQRARQQYVDDMVTAIRNGIRL